MKNLLTLILITLSFSLFAQKYYNNAVNTCAGTSSAEIIECIKGSTLLNYDFTDIKGQVISTGKTKKPIFIAAVSTRVAPFWAGIPALNKVAEKNHDKMEFILIFLDDEVKVNKVAHRINKYISLIPKRSIDKNENGMLDVSGFVHKLKDYPTGYLIDKNKMVIDVIRGAVTPNKERNLEQAIEMNRKDYNKALSVMIDVTE